MNIINMKTKNSEKNEVRRKKWRKAWAVSGKVVPLDKVGGILTLKIKKSLLLFCSV